MSEREYPYKHFIGKLDDALLESICIEVFGYLPKSNYDGFSEVNHHQLSRLLRICQSPNITRKLFEVCNAETGSDDLTKFTEKFERVIVVRLAGLMKSFKEAIYDNPKHAYFVTSAHYYVCLDDFRRKRVIID